MRWPPPRPGRRTTWTPCGWSYRQLLQGAPAVERVAPAAAALTPRQVAVRALLATGATNKEIGRRLGIGTGTAKLHVAAV